MPLPALNESARLRYFTFFYLYVMQGIPAGFALTAIANYLVGQGVASNIVGSFVAIVGIPWILQFVWGPIIDRYQYSIIGHRKHWVVLTQLIAFLASLSLLLVKNPVQQITLLSVVFFIHSNFASIQDASVDAIAIFVVPEDERGRVNAFMRGGFLLGVSFGAALLSTVLHAYSFFTAALVQSLTLLALTILTFFIKLDKRDPLLPTFGKKQVLPDGHTASEDNPSLKWLFKELWNGMTTRNSLQIFGVIALVYLCFSIFIRSYSYYIIHDLHWHDNDVSVLQGSWGSILTFGVIVVGGIISDRIGATRLQMIVMWIFGLFLLLLCGFYYLWTNRSVTTAGLILWNFADPMMSVSAFPILMALCRPQVEGSQFTAYMAFINFCDVIGSYVTGWALLVIPAPWLGLICGLIVTLLAAFLYIQKQTRLRKGSLQTLSTEPH